MSRLKATGNSHKKKSTTYESKRSKPSKQLDRQRTFFHTFRKEYVSTSSTVNNDEDKQLTDNETEMQIDTPLENMTDAFDESEESTHDSDDSSNDSEENELEIQHETITTENNNQERKRRWKVILKKHAVSNIGKLGIRSNSTRPKKKCGYVKYVVNTMKVNIGIRRP